MDYQRGVKRVRWRRLVGETIRPEDKRNEERQDQSLKGKRAEHGELKKTG